MSYSPPPADVSGYEPPASLWALVETNVPESERVELKRMMGESLVEQSLELHDEVSMLRDIWRDYRDETDEISAHRSFLPEPPAARERLKQEIRFIVENIRVKAKENGRDLQRVLCKHNSEVLEYVMENKRPDSTGSRPSTSCSSRDGRETPMRSTPGSDRLSQISTVSDEVQSVSDKLNVVNFEEVCQHLRETLEDEVQQLLDDINFLQSCLDEEADFRASSALGTPEPSLQDLREERTQLQKDYMSTDLGVDVLRERSLGPKSASRRMPQTLTPVGSAGKIRHLPTPKSATPPGAQRSSPMKASHQLGAQILTIETDFAKTQAESGAENNHVRRTGSGMRKASPAISSPNHNTPPQVTVRTGSGSVSRSAKLVKVATVHAPVQNGMESSGDAAKYTPSPPSSAKPKSQARPGSADRFRKMVIQCRDGT